MPDEDRGAHRASPDIGLDAPPPQASEEQEVRQAAAVLLTGGVPGRDLARGVLRRARSHAPLAGAAIDAGIVALLLLVRVAGRKRRAALKAAPPVDISMYTDTRQAWLRRHPDELVKLAAERAAKRPAQPS
jgi:hypothetical protein